MRVSVRSGFVLSCGHTIWKGRTPWYVWVGQVINCWKCDSE